MSGREAVDGDRVAADVSAGRDDGVREGAEQQMVERRIRKHHTVKGRCLRDIGREAGCAVGLEQDDGRGGGAEDALFIARDPAVAANRLEVRHHHRERLGVAMLAGAETGDSIRVAGVSQELESADAFQGDDLAAAEGCRSVGDGYVEARAAGRACDGLGMEAAVEGIGVLGAAAGTQFETGERGVRTVVGYVENDAVARAATGAVGERDSRSAVVLDR